MTRKPTAEEVQAAIGKRARAQADAKFAAMAEKAEVIDDSDEKTVTIRLPDKTEATVARSEAEAEIGPTVPVERAQP